MKFDMIDMRELTEQEMMQTEGGNVLVDVFDLLFGQILSPIVFALRDAVVTLISAAASTLTGFLDDIFAGFINGGGSGGGPSSS